MTYRLLSLVAFIAVGILGDEFSIVPINSSSGLYYEGIGEVYLSNNNWEFVTYIDYGDYLIFYQYIHQQAEKLKEFCTIFNQKLANSTECDKKLMQVEANMDIVTERHQMMSTFLGLSPKRRKKRFWQALAAIAAPYILQPLGEGLSRSLFGQNDRRTFEEYNHQIMALHQSQNDIVNEIQNQRTIFKIDSETKSKQIDYLKRAQDKYEEQLKIVKETIVRDYVEKEKEIKDLNELLDITRSQLKEQERISEKHSKDILQLTNTAKELDANLNKLGERVFSNTERINYAEARIQLNSVTQDFLFLWTVFQVEQEKLFKGIINSNNRYLDPYVINPVKLVDLLQKAMPYLPEGTKFPVHPEFENAMELYNLVEPNIYFYNYTVVFRLNIQLVHSYAFNIYRITSLPVMRDRNKFVFILPDKPYLLIDSADRQYALITQEQFEKCSVLRSTKFICADTSEFIDVSNPVCEVQLFIKDEISDTCNVRAIMPLKLFALQLTNITRWIYAAPEPSNLMVRCGNSRRSIVVRNSGFLDTGTCTVSFNGTLFKHTLPPHSDVATTYHYYSPNAQIGKFINHKAIKNNFKDEVPVSQRVIFPYDFNEMKKELEIKSLQINSKYNSNRIKEEEAKTGDENQYNAIQITVVIAVALVTIVLIGLIIFVNKIFHCNVQSNSNSENRLILKG